VVYEKSYCNQPEIATQPKADGDGVAAAYIVGQAMVDASGD